jgi:hypothetical protein
VTFATWPLAAIAAAIAIPALIILYFLKLRRRDVEVSTTLLWKKAIQDLQANAPFQKLRRNILLFLQLLALALILLALAQPEFKDQALSNQRQVILIDRSASMQATDGDRSPVDAAASAAPAASPASSTTRLESAKKRALAMVEQMKEPGLFQDKAEEAMVIAFDTSAEVRQAFTSNKAELRKAIEGIEPSDAPSGLERAITLAKAYGGTQKFEDQVEGRDTTVPGRGFVPHSPPATIHLFSDGRLPDSDRIQTEATDNVVYHAVGSPEASNVGITGLRAERAFDNPGKVSIFVGLQSTARTDRRVQVELVLDDTVVKVSQVPVPGASKAIQNEDEKADAAAGEKKEERWNPGLGGTVYQIERSEGAIARVRISPSPDAPPTETDTLDADNIAYLVIPPARRLSVALITSGNLFIKSALDGMNLSKLDVLKPDEFQKLLDGDQLAQYDVFIFDRVLPDVKLAAVDTTTPATVPSTPPATPAGGTPPTPATPAPTPIPSGRRPGLPPGRSLVLGAIPSPPLGVVDEGPGDQTLFAPGNRDHPALRLASLDKVNISKSRKVRILPDTPVRDIATLINGQPGILEISDSTALALVVPFDVTDTDWPFDPGWVLFLVSSTLYLADANIGGAAAGGGGAGLVGDSVRCGETLSTRLPTGATAARITLPTSDRLTLEPGVDGSVAFGPIAKTGIYTISWQGQSTASDVTVDGRARRAVAANLLSPDESDIGTRKTLALAREIVQAQTQKEVALTRKLWPWLLMAALAFVMFEWWVYNRKVMI